MRLITEKKLFDYEQTLLGLLTIFNNDNQLGSNIGAAKGSEGQKEATARNSCDGDGFVRGGI
jgi:hypothetical protein